MIYQGLETRIAQTFDLIENLVRQGEDLAEAQRITLRPIYNSATQIAVGAALSRALDASGENYREGDAGRSWQPISWWGKVARMTNPAAPGGLERALGLLQAARGLVARTAAEAALRDL